MQQLQGEVINSIPAASTDNCEHEQARERLARRYEQEQRQKNGLKAAKERPAELDPKGKVGCTGRKPSTSTKFIPVPKCFVCVFFIREPAGLLETLSREPIPFKSDLDVQVTMLQTAG